MRTDHPGGRVVAISGGTSGIGAGLVAAFLAAGDRVHTFGRDPLKVERLRAAHAAVADRLVVETGDVAAAAFRADWVERLGQQAGRLDVLINNAGVLRPGATLEEDLDDWRLTLEVNLLAPFAWTQASLPLLEASSGAVVINISSACARHPFSTCTSTSYSVSKAGLDMLTRRLAQALAPRGIRVNGVAPGVVASAMWGDASELRDDTVRQRHLLGGQIVTAEAVADACLFLASPQARLVTGETLAVDAGYVLG